MKYYLVNERHREIYRPATTNSRIARAYAYAMNLVTPGTPYSVTNNTKLDELFENGWAMCDWAGLFRLTGDGIVENEELALPF